MSEIEKRASYWLSDIFDSETRAKVQYMIDHDADMLKESFPSREKICRSIQNF